MCWRTYFLRRMESLAKGTHYNICACARKETTEGWKKTRRYGRALHDTRVLTCLTSGSRHVRHPGLGMHDTRVSDTRKRLTGEMTQEGNNTETCNEKKDRKKKCANQRCLLFESGCKGKNFISYLPNVFGSFFFILLFQRRDFRKKQAPSRRNR